MPVIQALPRMAGMIADPVSDARLLDDPAVEGRSDRRGVRHAVADGHQPAGMKNRHARREAGSGRGAVEPPGRDDDGVLRHRADALPRCRELHDAHARDRRVFGMRAGKLLPGGGANRLSRQREVTCLVRLDLEAQRVGVGNRVPHAAVGDVHRQRPEPFDLERRVEPVGEAGDVRELDALAAPVTTRRAYLDDATGRFEPEDRLRLAHLDHPRLEQDGGGADRVRSGHRRILGRLHDDEPGVAVRPRRGHDEVRVGGHAPARLAEQQPPEPVAVALERLHLLEHRRAAGRQHAADDDVSDLTAGVTADDGDHPPRAHRSP